MADFVDYNGNDVIINPEQVLVNNDFLIWQKGDTITTTNALYVADMWKVYCPGGRVTASKVENGLKIDNIENADYVNIYQPIYNRKDLNGKTLFFNYSKNDTIIKTTHTAIYLEDSKVITCCSINYLKKGDIINWADCFVETDCRHIKETKSKALLRTSPYIFRYNGFVNGFLTWGKLRNSVINFKIDLPAPFIEYPRIEFVNILNDIIYSNSTTNGSDIVLNTVKISFNIKDNFAIVQYIRKNENENFPVYDYWTSIDILFSCEPMY